MKIPLFINEKVIYFDKKEDFNLVEFETILSNYLTTKSFTIYIKIIKLSQQKLKLIIESWECIFEINTNISANLIQNIANNNHINPSYCLTITSLNDHRYIYLNYYKNILSFIKKEYDCIITDSQTSQPYKDSII